MRVDAPDLAKAAGAAVPSHYRPHPRYRSAATGVAGAGLLPTFTVNHLNQDASGTLSPPASRTALRWPRGSGKTSDCGDFGQCRQRSALGKPRTSRLRIDEFPDLVPMFVPDSTTRVRLQRDTHPTCDANMRKNKRRFPRWAIDRNVPCFGLWKGVRLHFPTG